MCAEGAWDGRICCVFITAPETERPTFTTGTPGLSQRERFSGSEDGDQRRCESATRRGTARSFRQTGENLIYGPEIEQHQQRSSVTVAMQVVNDMDSSLTEMQKLFAGWKNWEKIFLRFGVSNRKQAAWDRLFESEL
jgi:hypothetical protein